jgi:hypothetical protein
MASSSEGRAVQLGLKKGWARALRMSRATRGEGMSAWYR